MSDLGCWALVKRVAGLLPDIAIRQLLCMPAAEPIKSVYRESELVINPPDPPAIIAAAAEDAPVLVVTIDADAPAQYMRRPKIPRWECQAYTDWVKTQDCCGCGKPGDDPHHVMWSWICLEPARGRGFPRYPHVESATGNCMIIWLPGSRSTVVTLSMYCGYSTARWGWVSSLWVVHHEERH